jgi:hypothetical protein
MRAGVALLLAVALAGCGAAAPTDPQIARRGLIARGDLPAGWRDVRDGRAVRCPVLRPTRRAATVVADSHEFVRGSAGLESSVWVFPSAAAARRAFAALSGLPVQGCWGPGVVRAIAARNRLVVGRVTRAPVALGGIGDARAAGRVAANISQGGATDALDVDMTFVRTGRAVATGVFIDTGAPLDPALRTRLLRRQARRLAALQA